MKKTIITICSSANFYKQAVEVEEYLEKQGFNVLLPATAQKMKAADDYEVSHYKTWFGDTNDYHKKTALMRGHFEKVAKGDACLVLNYQKHGKSNYIGGNVLMEMALAFYLGKPIYLLNEIPEESAFLEEIIGMQPILLHGKVEELPNLLEK